MYVHILNLSFNFLRDSIFKKKAGGGKEKHQDGF